MEIVIFWVVFCIVVGLVAGSRGRSGFGWFLLSMVISPLLGLILVLAFGRPPGRAAPAAAAVAREGDGEHVRCPECRELVRFDARRCKHCGATLTPSAGR